MHFSISPNLKRHKMKNSIFFFILLSFFACKDSTTETGEKSNNNSTSKTADFEGYFSYLADANMFQSCDGKIRMPVEMKGEYLTLEKAYSALGLAGKRVFVRLNGQIEDVAAMEGDGTEKAIVVTEVVELTKGKECSNTITESTGEYSKLELGKIKNAMTIRGSEAGGEIITGADLIAVNFTEEEVFELVFKPKGAAKMKALTTANLGENMEIRLGEEVISKPKVRAVIALEKMQVTGMKKESIDKILN